MTSAGILRIRGGAGLGLAALALLVAACAGGPGGAPPHRAFTSLDCISERAELERQAARIASRFGPAPAPEQAAAGFLRGLRSAGFGALDMLRRLLTDVETENRWIGWSIDAFDDVSACRGAAAAIARADAEAGRMTRDAAVARLAEIRAAYAIDVALLKTAVGEVSENTQVHAAIYNDLAAASGAAPVTVAAYEPPERRAPAAAPRPAPPAPAVAAPAAPEPEPAPVAESTPSAPETGEDAEVAYPEGSAPIEQRAALTQARAEILTNIEKRDAITDRLRVAEASPPDLGLDFSENAPVTRFAAVVTAVRG